MTATVIPFPIIPRLKPRAFDYAQHNRDSICVAVQDAVKAGLLEPVTFIGLDGYECKGYWYTEKAKQKYAPRVNLDAPQHGSERS